MLNFKGFRILSFAHFAVFLLVLVCLLPFSLRAERLGELTAVLKPQMIKVHQDHLYVVEGHKIHHFHLPDLRYLGLIGKEGEGPGEFRLDPARTLLISIMNGELRSESRHKVVIFSLDGRFLREEKKIPTVLQVLPFGPNQLVHRISSESEGRSFFTLDLCDRQGKKIKQLYRQKFFQFEQYLYPIADGLNFCVIGDRVWVEESPDGFILECFDTTGSSIKKVQTPVTALAVTSRDKDEAFAHYLKIPFLTRLKNEQGEAALKQLLSQQTVVCPDHFPPIRHLKWDGQDLVARTYDRQGDQERHILLDPQGRLRGSVLVPKPKEIDFLVAMQGDKQYYDVYRGHYYYLRTEEDEEDGESWILHSQVLVLQP
jgi:hypothetical protein